MAHDKKYGIEIGEEEALTIMAETILDLVQKGIYSINLTTDNDQLINVTMTPLGAVKE